MKPLFDDKGVFKSEITLIEQDEILLDDNKVAETQNTYFKEAVTSLDISIPHVRKNILLS